MTTLLRIYVALQSDIVAGFLLERLHPAEPLLLYFCW